MTVTATPHAPAAPTADEGEMIPLPVLVVIPTLDEAANIESVIGQLEVRGGDLPKGIRPAALIVVADGGSTDGTQERVSRLAQNKTDLILLDNPRRTQGSAMNLAVSRYGVPGGIAIRCDAHADYPPGFVGNLVTVLARTGADSVVTPMDSVGSNCFSKAVAWVSDTPVGSGGSAHRGGHKSGWIDHGHHAAFLVDSYLANDGGYDESFTHNEDAEFDCRLRKRGGRVFLDATIRVRYHPRDNVRGLWRQYRSYGRGRSRTVRRHPESMRARQLMVPTAVVGVWTCLALSIVLPWLGVLPAVYAGALSATSLGIAIMQKSPCGLLAGPAAAVMHLAWTFGFLEGLATIRQSRWTFSGRPIR